MAQGCYSALPVVSLKLRNQQPNTNTVTAMAPISTIKLPKHNCGQSKVTAVLARAAKQGLTPAGLAN